MKPEFSRQIFRKYSDIKFDEKPSNGSPAAPNGQMDGQTDMTNPIATFRHFANTPN
jgi:hypothetical protein